MNKISIFLTLVIIFAGAFFYFSSSDEGMNSEDNYNDLFKQMKFKTAYTSDGQLKVFVSASPKSLFQIETIDGDSVPYNNMVIGYDEANMMKKENLFKSTGDEIQNLFGINTSVGGVLKQTGTALDDFHFLDTKQYSELSGEENKLFVRTSPKNETKLFYTFDLNDSLALKLAEGDIEDYKVLPTIAKKTYYPVILGSKEAEMMRNEGIFSNVGDPITDFFGRDVFVVAIAEETGTALDMLHLIPLGKEDLDG